jgi:hypothetical protein
LGGPTLTEQAAELWTATGAGPDLRLIGGLAVGVYVGASARATADIDVVAMTPLVRDRIRQHLVSLGYEVCETGGWLRGLRSVPPAPMVDIAEHPVLQARTFDTLSLRGEPRPMEVSGQTIYVAGANDLALLKTAAHRDQDLVDLLTLAAAVDLAPEVVEQAAALDDAERAVSAGATRARQELRCGSLATLCLELLGRSPSIAELARLQEFLEELEELEERGL